MQTAALGQTYTLPEGVKGKLTFHSCIPQFGQLTLTRDSFAHYDLAITNRERLTEIYEEVRLLERPEREAQHGQIITAAITALLHNNLGLNFNTFAVTVQALFTEDTRLIIDALSEVFIRLGLAGVPLTVEDIFGDTNA